MPSNSPQFPLSSVERDVSLQPYTTLKAGGCAEYFSIARTSKEIGQLAISATRAGFKWTIIGGGSNVLVADNGVQGLTILNRATRIELGDGGRVVAETGARLQEVFLKAAQMGLSGLEFAVGIPGSLGGALASNAGAYRASISDHIVELEVVVGGVKQWVKPDFMDFSYRDSRLRNPMADQVAVLSVAFRFKPDSKRNIFARAKEYQAQRISKQPAPASAGSFFKNVTNFSLAQGLESLPSALKERGLIPAGYLIEAAGLKGFELSGAEVATGHANFIVNRRGATAATIRRVAEHVKATVKDRFEVDLEEEVLYFGDWSEWPSQG